MIGASRSKRYERVQSSFRIQEISGLMQAATLVNKAKVSGAGTDHRLNVSSLSLDTIHRWADGLKEGKYA